MTEAYERAVSLARANPVVTGVVATAIAGVAWYAIQPVNAVDKESGGGVQFVLQENLSVFPTQPVAVGEGTSWGTVKPTDKMFVEGLLAPVVKALPGAFRSKLLSLSALGSFVFPGGGTFTFQNPAVNNAFALYTTIQYQNPN